MANGMMLMPPSAFPYWFVDLGSASLENRSGQKLTLKLLLITVRLRCPNGVFSQFLVHLSLVMSLVCFGYVYLCCYEKIDAAIGLGIAVIVVQTITVPANNLLLNYFLADGALEWAGLPDVTSVLSLFVFIGVIASMVQIMEMVLDKYVPALSSALGNFYPDNS